MIYSDRFHPSYQTNSLGMDHWESKLILFHFRNYFSYGVTNHKKKKEKNFK